MPRVKTAYKFRMYPNKLQEAQLDLTLDTCRHLYNLALADRKTSYEVECISRSYEDQAAMLVAEKKDGNFTSVFSQVLQDVLRRLDKAFKAFFRRVKSGEKPGYPRFKGAGWYKSFTYPQAGFKIKALN
jgi:putative transposase